MARISLLAEFWHFLRQRKKYWLMPIVIMLMLLGLLLVLTANSALAPFIYTLF
jgi:drug/metabolite transporter superfamily protein YnfA